jgi:hypothetical protein
MALKCKLGEKYCFERDEEGHWYCVPLNKKELFNEILYSENDEECEKFNDIFDSMRLSMHISNYSFVDPDEISKGELNG